jgi:hypothetical protein
MVGKSAFVCLSLIAALALLLLFASTNPATAGTFKSNYPTTLSCNGPDGTYGTADDSCVNGAQGAYSASLTADMLSSFSITGMCGNAIDDDADTVINDGCWTRGAAPESGAQCNNAINDDPGDDTFINDGCPKVGAAEENHSNFGENLITLGIPDTWTVATDKQIPDGAYVGRLVADSTLALFGGKCISPTQVTIPMFDCTTDNFEGVNDGCPASGAAETGARCNDHLDNDGDTLVNDGCPAIPGPGTTGRETGAQCSNATDDDGDGDPVVAWTGDGSNLTNAGTQAGNLPTGCTHYPTFLNDQLEGMTPRARYYGFTTVVGDATQLEFLIFSPGQLTAVGELPETDVIDSLGYANYVVLDNPAAPNLPGNPLDEFCTPLATTTDLFGKTDGDGTVQTSPSVNWREPGYSVAYPGDKCDSPAVDNDGDTTANEFCGYQRVKNPAANKGIWGTGSHLAGAYAESNRDADGDTIVNNEDECAFVVDNGVDADNDNIDSACDPNDAVANADQDGDGYSNQADNCPFVAQVNQNDADLDGIGDACDPNPNNATTEGKMLNDMPVGSICIGAADTDGDGWCDATEDINPGGGVLSNKNNANSVPEYIALDYAIRAGDPAGSASPPGIENPPGYAPRTCTDYVYYDVNQNHPADPHATGAPAGASGWVDNDGDTQYNATGTPPDANCSAGLLVGDTDGDGKADGSDNCPSVWNPSQLDTDGDGQGDACDADDDADGINDVDEWRFGGAGVGLRPSDPKNVCDPRNFDLKVDNKINVLDVTTFIAALKVSDRPCFPPVNTNVCP